MYLRIYRSTDESIGNQLILRRSVVLVRLARFVFHWRRLSPAQEYARHLLPEAAPNV